MSDSDSRIAELEARNAALQARNRTLTETALVASKNRLRTTTQMLYLFKMVERHGVPVDWGYFNGLGEEDLASPPTVPPRRADIQLIN